MSVTLTIRDETTAGTVVGERPLDFPGERLTARALIRERVYQEVQDHNRDPKRPFRGLVQPTDAERALNGPAVADRLRKSRPVDWRQQFDRALAAFERNRFFILVDDRQAEGLDDEFAVGPATVVSFVKLTPLVGG